MREEKFYLVPDFPRYEISKSGVLRRSDTKRVLKPCKSGLGYTRYTLCKDGVPTVWLVHRLLGTLFIPNPNNYRGMNHINGVKNDNRLENLEWLSQSDNVKHGYRIGTNTPRRGIRRHLRKVSAETAAQMQVMRNERYKLREIAEKFGVALSQVWSNTTKP